MQQNGCIPRKQKGILNFKEDMKKNKMRHYETLLDGMFPQVFPRTKWVGKQKVTEPRMVHNPEPHLEHDQEPQQPALDEIWEWLGNPDEY